jgi:hypothetical protein
MAGVPLKSTTAQFAEAWASELLSKAMDQLAPGEDSVTEEQLTNAPANLQGKARLVLDDLAALQDTLSGDSYSKEDLLTAGREYVASQAESATDSDGRIANSGRLPHQLRADLAALRSGRVAAGPAKGSRFSVNKLNQALAKHGLEDAKAEEVVETAAATDENGYLTGKELDSAAQATSVALPSNYRWKDSVVDSIMDKYELTDRGALLHQAVQHDSDGNRYLKRSEIEAAAKVLSGQVAPRTEVGIISDLDKTVILPDDSMVPGSAALMTELEGAELGDMHYVTARTADRAAEMPEWLDENGLPLGTLDTGVSGIPWVAQAEKVKDISTHFDANPDQHFVLFGDSSHRDPEAYREIIDKYPGRVTAAFIHKVNNINPTRVEGLRLVDNYAQAAAQLFEIGVFSEAQARRVMDSAQVDGLNITDAQIDALIAAHQPG